MPAKRKPHVPPVRANADGTGFQHTDPHSINRSQLSRLAPPTASTSGRPRASAAPDTDRRDQRNARAPVRSRIPNADDDSSSSTDFSSSVGSSPRETSRPETAALRNTTTTEKLGGGPHSKAEVASKERAGAPQQRKKASATPSTNAGSAPAPLTIVVDDSLLSSEVKLAPARCRQLGVTSGVVVCISPVGESPLVFAEVLMAAGQAGDSIALNNDAASLFQTRTVTVGLLPSADDTLPSAEAVTLQVHPCYLEDQCLSPSSSSAVQWSALFRRSFQHRIAYVGMRATLRLATHRIEVEIGDVRVSGSTKSSTVRFGTISHATHIGVTFSPPADGTEPVVAEGDTVEADSAVQVWQHRASRSSDHILIVGGAGTGKTHQLNRLAAVARGEGRHVLPIRVEEIPQGDDSEVHSASVLVEAFQQAKQLTPCLVCIDDLDLICGASASSAVGSQWAMSLVATTLCEQMRSLRRGGVNVVIAASSASKSSLHPSLLGPDYLGGAMVELTPPASSAARERCFLSCLRSVLSEAAYAAITSDTRDRICAAVADAHGYTQRDLHRVAQSALLTSFEAHGTVRVGVEDVEKALKTVRPSALRQFEVTVPDVTWNDIGGSEDAKRTLQEVVQWCLGKQSWIFTQFKVTPPKGVLLYGPPGCSKTMLAKALANESKMNFVSVKGPEIFSKWVGDSEKAIRDIFTRARAASPCVVFVDELDGMCGHRGRGGVSDRVVSQFLTELDGLPAAFASEDTALVFVAATNRPDSIDEAVLRPGRIDRLVYVGLPVKVEREAIAAIQLRTLPTAPDVTPLYVAERTEGYTGAEVVAVVKEAAFTAVATDLQARFITCADVDAALKKVLPRIALKDVEWYRQWAHSQA